MFSFKKIQALQAFLTSIRQQNRTIGFIPTMGALHQGHLAIIQQAAQAGDYTVCSIFVNPTQFNDARDLEKYPRTPEKDIPLLISVGCDALFMPSVDEIYPPDQQNKLHFQFGHLANVMEGAFRPGHFAGVAQVVSRLLDIVQPDRLYMGQKDFQQVKIVESMLQQLHSPVQLVISPTIREADGLAMSSRNTRLTLEFRQQAPAIYQTLLYARQSIGNGHSPQEVQQQALEKLTQAGLKPEYFEIVDRETLLPIERFNEAKKIIACVAAWAGEVRLIDNLELKGE
ncbi:MAG: pantoate--beta-alanine ligase [Saprospiraceae bacterium]